MPKPVIHGRDHAPGGADPIPFTLGSPPIFACTGGPAISITDAPVVLDNDVLSFGTMHFYSSDAATFDVSDTGRPRFLRPGMYVIGAQIVFRPTVNFTVDTHVSMVLEYENGGYSIEIPYMFGYVAHREEIKGTFHVWPAGTGNSVDIGLQRIHPVSLLSDDFPNEIRLGFDTSNYTEEPHPFWWAIWGWRLGEPLDAYHSD